MCLSVVGTIECIKEDMAYVDIQGVKQWICIDLIEHPSKGEKVLIHAGCAINRLRPSEAEQVIEALQIFEKGTRECYGRDD